jgi:hypothetical protein
MLRTSFLALALLAGAARGDHDELDATLHAPYQGGPDGARTFTLALSNPQAREVARVPWSVQVERPDGRVLKRWRGTERMFRRPVSIRLHWTPPRLPAGLYTVRLRAGNEVEQAWTIAVGRPPTVRAQPALLAAPVPPYKVWYANLHSQTNHSDGGAALDNCKGAQEPLSAPHGPGDAYAYARQRGLDILMVSEHNHMYDGSEGANPDADPERARSLYRDGLRAAASFSAAHPGFLALYGLEWGVINNGGHLNIFNSPELLQWETDRQGRLIGDTATPRNDYAALYTLMRRRGWIGQFNHPSTKGQFSVDGKPLAYHPDGDEAMVLCEVLNTSAFSTNTSESETRRSNYEAACNKLLEAGWHVAFSSNQDNHCANWGASYTNRTGILIPTGTALTQESFIEALRARRVFATMDKGSTLILTANGRMMGERFTNRGPLRLEARFSSSAGKAVSQAALMEGVPGRGGMVSALAQSMSATITPARGEHFYYARVVQEDGNILWSAPVWVTQED